VPVVSEFMNKTRWLNYRADLKPGGATALFDAVGLACTSRMEADGIKPARRVLVLVSDGDDNMSHILLDEAISIAQEAGVVIFAVSTGNMRRGNNILRWLAESTGGEAFFDLGPNNVGKTFSAIGTEIENMYLVGFEPAGQDHKGFHSVELKVSGSGKVRVRAPKGYYLK
jgi:VWFA-related protein